MEILDHRIKFEIDSGASDTFCCEATWQTLGKPILQPVSVQYQVAEGSPLPVVGQFQSTASIDGKSPDVTFPVIVTKVPNLNLLGRLAMMKLKLTNLTEPKLCRIYCNDRARHYKWPRKLFRCGMYSIMWRVSYFI